MGLAFVAVGGNLVFGRCWTTLDSAKGTIVKQSGLLVPLWKEQFALSGYDGAKVRFEERDSGTSDSYPVMLQEKGARPDLALSSPTDYAAAREQGEYIAGFLSLPLVDAATDREVVVAPGRPSGLANGSAPLGPLSTASAGHRSCAARSSSRTERSGSSLRGPVSGPICCSASPCRPSFWGT